MRVSRSYTEIEKIYKLEVNLKDKARVWIVVWNEARSVSKDRVGVVRVRGKGKGKGKGHP